MKCYKCGGKLKKTVTNLPFKVSEETIVIIKELPLWQCQNCQEYILEDSVMKKVEHIIKHVDNSAELEILKYAA